MSTAATTRHYDAGRLARQHGAYRVVTCPESEATYAEWLRGWDDADAEIRAAQSRNFKSTRNPFEVE